MKTAANRFEREAAGPNRQALQEYLLDRYMGNDPNAGQAGRLYSAAAAAAEAAEERTPNGTGAVSRLTRERMGDARHGLREKGVFPDDTPMWRLHPEMVNPEVLRTLQGLPPTPPPAAPLLSSRAKAGLGVGAALLAGGLAWNHFRGSREEAPPTPETLPMDPTKTAETTGTPVMPYGTVPHSKPFKPTPLAKIALDLSDLERPLPPPQALEDTHFALGTRYPLTEGAQGNMVGGVKEAATRLSKELAKPGGSALVTDLLDRHMLDDNPLSGKLHTLASELRARAHTERKLESNYREAGLPVERARVSAGHASRAGIREARDSLRELPGVTDVPLWKRRPEGFDPKVIEQLTKAEAASVVPRPGMGWKGRAGLAAAAIPLAAGALYFGHKQLKKREARLGDPREAESEMTPKAAELTGTPPMAYGALPRHKPFKPPAMPHKMAMLDLSHMDRPLPPAVALEDTHFALGTRYPLTTEGQMKMACAYFEEHSSGFSVEDRREFAYNLCKRASELGMADNLGDAARAYGGKPSNDLEAIKVAFLQRREHGGELAERIVDQLMPKLAEIQHEDRVRMLTLLDRDCNLEGYYAKGFIQDPILSTHEKWAAEEEFTEELAGFRVTASNLGMLARNQKVLREVFTPEVARKMAENPVATFKGLPRPLKILMARSAVAASNGENAPPRLD